MYGHHTALVTIRRGTTTDGFGDVVDTGTAVATGVPMSILEQSRSRQVPAEERYGAQTRFTGRCASTVDVRAEDQVEDQDTGTVYVVDDVYAPPSPVAALPARLAMRLVQ